MNIKNYTLFILFGFLSYHPIILAQKQAYIPNFLLDPNNYNNAQFSWDKTYQSDNFIIIWGNGVGLNPLNASNPDLVFDPENIADLMEFIYESYQELGFLIDDDPLLKMAQYKVPIVMNNTWGDAPESIVGWAEAYTDGFMPVFNVHPLATNGGETLAHEFAHSLQYLVRLDQLSVNNVVGDPFADAAGIFWETHAEYMATQLYPYMAEVWLMDAYASTMWGDWKNTYRNYPLLYHIQLTHGIQRVHDLWFQQLDDEYPIATYKRISNYSQEALNDDLFGYARRMATLDFDVWSTPLRNSRENNSIFQDLHPIQNRFTILESLDSPNHYTVGSAFAPEEFGYNVVPLHFQSEIFPFCVKIKFKGHTNVNDKTGWRYGFVALKTDGSTEYGEMHDETDQTIVYEVQEDVSALYWVVMGATANELQQDDNHNTWTGFPKHNRYPYDVHIENAVPEGFQDKESFRSYLKTNEGNHHSNGGGWVESSATVGAEVYVSPHAVVLGSSQITGSNTRIEGTSIVRDAMIGNHVHIKNNAIVTNSQLSSNQLVIIQDNAFIDQCIVTESAKVQDRAQVFNYSLSGNIIVGGDVMVYAEESCNNGVYFTLTNYFDNQPLACDQRTAFHPTNVSVNQPHLPFTPAQMAFHPGVGCLNLHHPSVEINKLGWYPNPSQGSINILAPEGYWEKLFIHDASGRLVYENYSPGKVIDLKFLQEGVYFLTLENSNLKEVRKLVRKD